MPTATGRAFTTANLLTNLAALKAINFGSSDPAGTWFVVPNLTTSNVEIWVWQPDSMVTTDEISVVRPDSIVPGSPGRCVQRLNFTSAQLGGILAAIAALTTTGLIERTTGGGVSTATVSSFIKTFLDDTDQSTARTTLGLGAAATRGIGTSTGTIRDAADTAYSNARTPTTHASTHLGGTDSLGLGTAAFRAIGTTTGTIRDAADAAYTNTRTPTAHVATHAVGGADALTVFGFLAVTVSSTLTAANQRQLINVDATSGVIIITLPAAATVGSGWAVQIRKTDTSANLVTISRSGTDLINGATTLPLAVQHQSFILFSLGGTSWGVVAGFEGTLPANTLWGRGATAGPAEAISSSIFASSSALTSKADLVSPNFTGTPFVPTATVGTNTTQAANTAFVTTALAAKADLIGGFVPTAQLPSYVDDILEFANLAGFPITGEAGKIYVTLNNNLTYRWSGTTYIEISASLALGITSATAYRGDFGEAAYTHSQAIVGNPHQLTTTTLGLGNVTNTSDVNKPVSTAQQAALDLKANLLSPSFTGGVGINKTSNSLFPLNMRNNAALGTTILSSLNLLNFEFTVAGGNNIFLAVTANRFTAGSAWDTSNVRMQKTVDSTLMGFIDFGVNNNTSSHGIGLGISNTAYLIIENNGDVFLPSETQSTSTTTGTQIITGGQAVGGNIFSGGTVQGTQFQVAGTKIIGARGIGWTAPTGTDNKGAFASDTATLVDVARRLFSLETALRTHGLLGT